MLEENWGATLLSSEVQNLHVGPYVLYQLFHGLKLLRRLFKNVLNYSSTLRHSFLFVEALYKILDRTQLTLHSSLGTPYHVSRICMHHIILTEAMPSECGGIFI
jgi:hypothetical protein